MFYLANFSDLLNSVPLMHAWNITHAMACSVKDELWVDGRLLGGRLVCVFSPVTECAVPAGTLRLPPHPPEGEGDTHTSLKDFRGLRQTVCCSRGVGRGLVAWHGAIYLIQLSSSYPAQ